MNTVHKFRKIVVFHPAAIGDTVLGTPVMMTLKYNFPDAQLIHFTHSNLIQLLKLCPAVDKIHPYARKDPLLKQRAQIAKLQADLLIDLTGSLRGLALTALNAKTVLHYHKQAKTERPIQHVVENFLSTLNKLNLIPAKQLFPSLLPTKQMLEEVADSFNSLPPGQLIGLVPGVGNFRPHRAWTESQWISLANTILATGKFAIVLIGGNSEHDLCNRIAQALKGTCFNVAGKLSLPQTAAVLKLCNTVISCDTGPAHIATAVGTPVVGLFGPTFSARSGAYGMGDLCLNVEHCCQCHDVKTCRITGTEGPGYCMSQIAVDSVYSVLLNTLHEHSNKGS